MRIFEMNGAKVKVPDACECGAVCTDTDIKAHLFDWNKSGSACSFCGKLIRVAGLEMKHHHLLGPKDWSPVRNHPHLEEEARWSSATWAEYEPHWNWMTTTKEYSADINAHISCAMKGMPHGNFQETVYNRPEGIPEGFGLPKACLDPCPVCYVVPTEADLARVAGRIYSFLGPCVYCGKPVRLESVELTHGSWAGKHTGQWHFETFRREEMLSWCGYSVVGSSHTSLDFSGHMDCAIKAMPFMIVRRFHR